MTSSRFSSPVSIVSAINHIKGGNSMTLSRSLSSVSEVIPAGSLKGGETIPHGTFNFCRNSREVIPTGSLKGGNHLLPLRGTHR